MALSHGKLGFQLMSLSFYLRDILSPPDKKLAEAGLKPGDRVLDFGCGPGGITVRAAAMVGAEGRVFALDIHPSAIEKVERLAQKKGIHNITTVQSDHVEGIDDQSLDVVLMYDVFHHLADPEAVLEQLHQALKPQGRLSFSDHHLKEEAIVSEVTGGDRFTLDHRGGKTYTFIRV